MYVQQDDKFLWGGEVLITGGTGTFGKEILRQLLALHFGPKRIVIFSRDELKQWEMERALSQHHLDMGRIRFFIGDVRDRQRLDRALVNISHVVHAAAMKQVPACEYNPLEAIKTNVNGAMNVIEAAIDRRVTKVVALSTDKAVEPVNLYGATKLVAERLFTAAGQYAPEGGTQFAVVRYGNVIGSRGSVVSLFHEQVQAGQELTITDPTMTRFLFSPADAVDFAMHTLKIATSGEIFAPTMISATVGDIAEAMYPGWPTRIIGTRPGEKPHETLISEHEAVHAVRQSGHWIIHPGNRAHEPRAYRSDTNPDLITPATFDTLVETLR